MTEKDQVYREPQRQIVDFAFDDAVADVFPDMIRRSVPGYETVIPITGLIAARHVPEGGLVCDLGCSLGATTLAVLRQIGEQSARVLAVDNSQAMLDRARQLIDDDRVTFRCEDLRETDVTGANVVLMNYVLQFIEPEERGQLLETLRKNMAPDGLLILSEKIRYESERDQTFHEATHLAYKQANGYSDLEVSQKRTALENVMIIDSEAEHRNRLADAGFTRIDCWFRCLNWISILAYR
jgi:tRNA (cmo5U34)-methyltransferase